LITTLKICFEKANFWKPYSNLELSHETLVAAQHMIFHTLGNQCFSIENMKS